MTGPVVDFLHPRRTPALGAWLLALGLAGVAGAAWMQHQWDTAHASRQAQQAEQAAAQRRAEEAARRPRLPTANERRLERIAPQLQQPWLASLRMVESATEAPVFLLAMTIDPASGRVQLDGEAPSFDHALAYVQRLTGDGPLVGVHLASHESSADAAGRTAMRFTVLAQWRSRP